MNKANKFINETQLWGRQAVLLRAMELDLRKKVEDSICPFFRGNLNFIQNNNVKHAALAKYLDSFPGAKADEENIETSIIPFLNAIDPINIIRSNKTYINLEDWKHIQDNYDNFVKFLVEQRNVTAHHRDFELLVDELNKFSKKIISQSTMWRNLSHAQPLALKLTADDFKINKDNLIDEDTHKYLFNNLEYHNLPEEDYSNWQFVGRRTYTKNIQEELFSANRNLILIHGQGGIGKTSLARYVCEKQLHSTNVDFIWWHSSKRRSYTSTGIETHTKTEITKIEEQIKEETGFSLNELKEFNALFVLDNMETEEEETVIRMANKLSSVGKVLLTGRNQIFGLGAYPVRVDGFTLQESRQFLVKVARFYGQRSLMESEEKKIEEWCKKLENSPLFLRNFVESVNSGQEPDEYFKSFDKYDDIISFVYFNVMDHFSKDALRLADLMDIDPSPFSVAMLSEITGWNTNRLSDALTEIRQSPLLEDMKSSGLAHYRLTDLAKRYIAEKRALEPIKEDFEREKIINAKKHREEFSGRKINRRIEDYSYFETHDEQDLLAGYNLNKVINEHLNESVDKKIERLIELSNQFSNYSPIELNLALLKVKKLNSTEAREYFISALDNANSRLNKEKIIYQFILFLIKEKDYKTAEEFFVEIDNNSSALTAFLGIQLKLNTSDPSSFDDLYKLFQREDLNRLPSERVAYIAKLLEIIIDTGETLLKEENFRDALYFLNQFLINLKGDFKSETFDQNNIDAFICKFLKVYAQALTYYDEPPDQYIVSLKNFVMEKDFNFHAIHYEAILEIKDFTDFKVFTGIYNALELSKSHDYDIFLRTRDLKKNMQGKIDELTRTNANAGMGYIKRTNQPTLIFYENESENYEELKEGDNVEWSKIIPSPNGKDKAFGVKKI